MLLQGREKIKSLNLRSKPQMNDTLADLNVVQLAGAESVEGNLEAAENEEKDSSAEADKENISIFDVSAAEDIPAMVNKSSDKPHPAGKFIVWGNSLESLSGEVCNLLLSCNSVMAK